MTSRQPKWTGPKTHGVKSYHWSDRASAWVPGSIWSSYRHKDHATQAVKDLSGQYPNFAFRVVPLRSCDKGAGGWIEYDSKEDQS